jgi:hypothetical protein
MKYALILCLFGFATVHAQRLADLENDSIDVNDKDVERYNRDNKVYKSNTEFLFDYVIVKDKDTLKCRFSNQEYGIPKWQLVKPDDADSLTVNAIGFAILPYYLNDNQTGVNFRYYNKYGRIVNKMESTGIIENAKNTWLHPPRSQFFAITEFNSFPFIKTPYAIGTKWTSGLTVGYFDSYLRFSFNLAWEGVLITKETLEIIEKVNLPTAFGVLRCFVVQGVAKSNLTETTSLFYYNETYGFIKIVYDLFDKSRLELTLKEVKKIPPPPLFNPFQH